MRRTGCHIILEEDAFSNRPKIDIIRSTVTARVAVPRDISLISVDNSYDFHPWPMSSIDLGYDYLGYAAVHVFVGDVPVRASRDRTVTGSARFLDRGSLGRPRSQRLRADLEGELL